MSAASASMVPSSTKRKWGTSKPARSLTSASIWTARRESPPSASKAGPDSDLLAGEEVTPDLDDVRLGRSAGRNEHGLRAAIVEGLDAEARGEAGALELPGRTFRNFIHDPDDSGHLESGEACSGPRAQLRGLEVGPGLELDGGADLLSKLRVRDREAEGLADAGVPEEDVVHFAGRDLLAAAVDDFFESAGQAQVAVFVDRAQVAGAEPPVSQRFGVGGVIGSVPGGDVGAPNGDLAGGIRRAAVRPTRP